MFPATLAPSDYLPDLTVSSHEFSRAPRAAAAAAAACDIAVWCHSCPFPHTSPCLPSHPTIPIAEGSWSSRRLGEAGHCPTMGSSGDGWPFHLHIPWHPMMDGVSSKPSAPLKRGRKIAHRAPLSLPQVSGFQQSVHQHWSSQDKSYPLAVTRDNPQPLN